MQAHHLQPHHLHALCPYFAMFPADFARRLIAEYTRPGDIVLDPFSGRGTTLLESLIAGREAIAADINPVAYCITAAKAETPSVEAIHAALRVLEEEWKAPHAEDVATSSFFRRCFHPHTLRQLLFLR